MRLSNRTIFWLRWARNHARPAAQTRRDQAEWSQATPFRTTVGRRSSGFGERWVASAAAVVRPSAAAARSRSCSNRRSWALGPSAATRADLPASRAAPSCCLRVTARARAASTSGGCKGHRNTSRTPRRIAPRYSSHSPMRSSRTKLGALWPKEMEKNSSRYEPSARCSSQKTTSTDWLEKICWAWRMVKEAKTLAEEEFRIRTRGCRWSGLSETIRTSRGFGTSASPLATRLRLAIFGNSSEETICQDPFIPIEEAFHRHLAQGG